MSRLEQEKELLAEVIEHLAPLERRAGSDAEREAADWIAERLSGAGCEVTIDEEEFLDGYAGLMGRLSAAAAAAGVAAVATRRARGLAAAAGFGAMAAIADDISNGPRVARRAVQQPKPTQNVVAIAGDPAAERTLVVLAHHDAAPTGAIFDERAQTAVAERIPGVIERFDTSLPQWWLALAGPGLVGAGALRGKKRMAAFGTALSALSTAIFADIARNRMVPGANDNLSAVAAIIALAERLRAEPVEGLRVMLVSAGAEEVIQGGIYGFARRHFPQLDRDKTWVLNLDTVGSPVLVMLEGEGPIVMEDYFDLTFRDLVYQASVDSKVRMRRGMRSRNSTDSVIPSRAGYPTATLVSINRHKALPHYHQMSDLPKNLHYRTISDSVTVTEAVARELAARQLDGLS